MFDQLPKQNEEMLKSNAVDDESGCICKDHKANDSSTRAAALNA